MLDFVIEQIAFDRIIAAVAVVVSLAFIRSYAGGVKNDHRRDLHQRTVILAVSLEAVREGFQLLN